MITLRNISIVTGGSNWANWARTQHYSTLSQVLCALWVLSLSLSLSLSLPVHVRMIHAEVSITKWLTMVKPHE